MYYHLGNGLKRLFGDSRFILYVPVNNSGLVLLLKAIVQTDINVKKYNICGTMANGSRASITIGID